jgi:hypothetical protein
MLYDAINVGDQRAWCGPTVIASITGFSVPTIKEKIKAHRRNKKAPVKGTYAWERDRVLLDLGWISLPVKVKGKPTFAQWLREPRDMDVAHVVRIRNHVMVVKGRWFVDTYTGGKVTRITKAPHKRARVLEVDRVIRRQP